MAVEWPRKLHILRENYHHGFEGNQCRMLLKKISVLEELVSRECDDNPNLDYEDHPAKVFIDVLKALDLVVAGCFRKTLTEDYAAQIQSSSDKFME